MNVDIELLTRAVAIGVGATAVMDLWAMFLKKCFGTPSLDYSMVGRWLGHLSKQLTHKNIQLAKPISGESILGWAAHYIIGAVFAILLIAFVGAEWEKQPTILPALIFGVFSIVAPFFILQPGMGAGIAGSKTPRPRITRLRSLMAHLSFGIGLYIAAWLLILLEG